MTKIETLRKGAAALARSIKGSTSFKDDLVEELKGSLVLRGRTPEALAGAWNDVLNDWSEQAEFWRTYGIATAPALTSAGRKAVHAACTAVWPNRSVAQDKIDTMFADIKSGKISGTYVSPPTPVFKPGLVRRVLVRLGL